MVLMVDIDGTISEDVRNEDSHLFESASVLPGAVQALHKLRAEGASICYFTARPASARDVTVRWLGREGFPQPQNLITDKPRSKGSLRYVYIDNTPVSAVTFGGSWEQTLRELKL